MINITKPYNLKLITLYYRITLCLTPIEQLKKERCLNKGYKILEFFSKPIFSIVIKLFKN